MNDQDYYILTISPRLIRACRLVQLETEGEFADESGRKVVRQLKWGDYGDRYRGHVVLMDKAVFHQCLGNLGVSSTQFFFTRLVSIDDSGRYDSKLNVAKWGIRCDTVPDPEPPESTRRILLSWEQENQALSDDDLIHFMRIGETDGEEQAREFLATVRARRDSFTPFHGDTKAFKALLTSMSQVQEQRNRKAIQRGRKPQKWRKK